jgi:hypothetical protein
MPVKSVTVEEDLKATRQPIAYPAITKLKARAREASAALGPFIVRALNEVTSSYWGNKSHGRLVDRGDGGGAGRLTKEVACR